MVDTNKLRAKMVENNFTVERLAEELKMNKSTLYRKLNAGGDDFSVRDVKEITKCLSITSEEAMLIFFSQDVA